MAYRRGPSVKDNRPLEGITPKDNRFRSVSSRLARSSGLRSQRRSLRVRSLQSGMRRSTRRSRRSSRLWWLRLSWRSRRSACLWRLWRTLLLARRRSRLPLRSCWSRLRHKGGAATLFWTRILCPLRVSSDLGRPFLDRGRLLFWLLLTTSPGAREPHSRMGGLPCGYPRRREQASNGAWITVY